MAGIQESNNLYENIHEIVNDYDGEETRGAGIREKDKG
jgi:hypothetical protein